jgi:hypothetical protein
MRKLIALSLLTVMLLAGGFLAPVHAQSPANDLKPTFISPTPGLYVNGWPAFTVSYPKEWVEEPAPSVFFAGLPRPDLPPGTHIPALYIDVTPSSLSLEEWAKNYMPVFLQLGTDTKILSDKPSQLKDGTRTREVELEQVLKNGPKVNYFMLITKKDVIFVSIILVADEGKLGEELKRIAYSLTFLPGREEPVQVPSDVRAFFDMWCTDIVSGDVKAIMEHYSDRFRHAGFSKRFVEQWFRNDPTSPIHQDIMSCEPTVTVFEPREDKAYVDGFNLEKKKGDANGRKVNMIYQQIINEHGEWKWYGNQK